MLVHDVGGGRRYVIARPFSAPEPMQVFRQIKQGIQARWALEDRYVSVLRPWSFVIINEMWWVHAL